MRKKGTNMEKTPSVLIFFKQNKNKGGGLFVGKK
jgi:hypothetical protein